MGDFLAPCPSGSTLAVGTTGLWAGRKCGYLEIGVTAEASPLPGQSAQHWLTEGIQTGKIAPPAKVEETDPKSCCYTLSLSSGCGWPRGEDRVRA